MRNILLTQIYLQSLSGSQLFYILFHVLLYSTKLQRGNSQYNEIKNIILQDIHLFNFNFGINGIDQHPSFPCRHPHDYRYSHQSIRRRFHPGCHIRTDQNQSPSVRNRCPGNGQDRHRRAVKSIKRGNPVAKKPRGR